jgi:hypothetical protein
MMKKIVAGASALAIMTSAALIPTKANANDWDRPAVGVNVGALSIGVGTDDDDDYDYGGPRAAAFIPAENGYCHIGREIGPDGYWHRVQVCE